MENKEYSEKTISLNELLGSLIKNWKYLLIFGIAGAVIATLYYSLLKENTYTSKVVISSNLANKDVNNYFGEYTIIENDFASYLTLLDDPELVKKTIDSLGIDDVSVSDVTSGLKVELDDDEKVLQTTFPITLELKSKAVNKILNLHISNFINYLNGKEASRMIDFYISKYELNKRKNEEKIALTERILPYYDSLLEEVSSKDDVFNNIDRGQFKDIFLLKGTFLNKNFLDLESDIIGFKKDLYDYQVDIKKSEKFLDSLSSLKTLYRETGSNQFKPFSFKLNVIKKAYDNPVVNAPNILKKAVLFFLLGSFIYSLIFVSRIFFRL